MFVKFFELIFNLVWEKLFCGKKLRLKVIFEYILICKLKGDKIYSSGQTVSKKWWENVFRRKNLNYNSFSYYFYKKNLKNFNIKIFVIKKLKRKTRF